MDNINISYDKLLSDKRVIDEIKRHLWIESEKAGYDIGFDQAKEDWLKKFSSVWLNYNMPDAIKKARIANVPKKTTLKTTRTKAAVTKKKANPKRRRAKSYLT
ncbi:MAG: hypothetical protein KAR05_05265 [Candidatus Omnitrophica bacterium]|nr:hypothetical protein [Candidatus Omnitrophota bacterium]